MKLFKICIAALICFCAFYSHAAPSGTADFYLAEPSKYEGKKVKVFVQWGERDATPTAPGYVLFKVYTKSGSIYMQVPEKKSKTFGNFLPKRDKDGNATNSKSYDGVLGIIDRGGDKVYGLVVK